MNRTLRLPRLLSRRAIAYRTFSISTRHQTTSPFTSGPSPPRLPKDEQEIFERLQRQSTGAFSTPRAEASDSPDSNASPASTPSPSSHPSDLRARINQSPDSQSSDPQRDSDGIPDIRIEGGVQIAEGEEVHPNLRRGAPPEFEGDVNPHTGEVGGPKNEPLRWGSGGDWSFNGRVTDF